ncbi:MAG: hypothetical protein H7Y38_18870 [Armatimonadetes bacterium]|nr:hypothetical protein [Armatimonadota bacterium]
MSETIYEILEGVRRTKAAYVCGRETIAAQVNGVGAVIAVPIRNLRSPKDVIETSGVRGLAWERILRATRADVVLPPIEITPGNRGIPIADVSVVENELDAIRRFFNDATE